MSKLGKVRPFSAAVWLAGACWLGACGASSTKHTVQADEGGDAGNHAGSEAGESSETTVGAGGATDIETAAGSGGAAGEALVNTGGVETAAGAAGVPSCVEGARCLSDTQAYACNNGVEQTLDCTDGCAADACLPSVLSSGWQLHQFALSDSPEATASYTFSADGLSALQAINAQPSIYYFDGVLQSVVVTGRFGVESANDDDFIGLAFGYQDPQHFYLFDWKQAAQTSACGTAAAGAMLKRYSGSAPFTLCSSFWDSSPTAGIVPLVSADQNPVGWLDNTVYDFRLVYKPGDISLEVSQGGTPVVTLQSNDKTYPSGKFGFYSCSQEQSRFELIEIQPAP